MRKGCRKVSSDSECDKKKKEKHVVYTIDEKTWNKLDGNKNRIPSYHVVGEDCDNPGTYKTQLGHRGPIRKNIKDPVKSTQDYYDELDKNKNPKPPRKLKSMHMCCPCKKE